MKVQIDVENSEGKMVTVFCENIRESKYLDLVKEVLGRCLFLEVGLKEFVESMGEDT